MNTQQKTRRTKRLSATARSGLIKVGVVIVVLGIALFWSAGRLNWAMGWVYVLGSAAMTALSSLLTDPDLLEERSEIREGAQKGDILLALLMARLGPLATLIVAGLDQRFGWSRVTVELQVVALALFVGGYAFTQWAVMTNHYFSGVVRIQRDRGHAVVSDGPYRIVRHPGYVGALVTTIVTALMLDSWWALIPAAVVVAGTFLRTAKEDRLLQAELEGYAEYAQRVRYRLLPGIW